MVVRTNTQEGDKKRLEFIEKRARVLAAKDAELDKIRLALRREYDAEKRWDLLCTIVPGWALTEMQEYAERLPGGIQRPVFEKFNGGE